MRVASIQLEMVDRPKDETIAHAMAMIDRVPAADLLLMPEIWPSGFFCFDRYDADAEPLDGPTVQAFRAKARERRCHLLMGSLVERRDGKRFTTPASSSARAATSWPPTARSTSSATSRTKPGCSPPGSEIVVVDTPWGRTGFSTCYDLRFPELFRRMVDQGAEVFLVASAWPLARIEAWRLFNRARAHENLAFLVSCNCAGQNAGKRYGGHSMIVDPWGQVLAEGGQGGEIVTAEIDPGPSPARAPSSRPCPIGDCDAEREGNRSRRSCSRMQPQRLKDPR